MTFWNAEMALKIFNIHVVSSNSNPQFKNLGYNHVQYENMEVLAQKRFELSSENQIHYYSHSRNGGGIW